MTERKRLPGLLFDKSTGWWFSNVKDTSKNCGRVKHTWAKNKKEAQAEIAAIQKEPLSPLKYLTKSKYRKWDVTLSPDKKQFAYRDARPTENPAIEIRDTNTGALNTSVELEGTGGEGLCWGKDSQGEKLLYIERINIKRKAKEKSLSVTLQINTYVNA